MHLHVRTRVAITQALTQSCWSHYQVLIASRGNAGRETAANANARIHASHICVRHTHKHARTYTCTNFSGWEGDWYSCVISLRAHTLNPVNRLVDTVRKDTFDTATLTEDTEQACVCGIWTGPFAWTRNATIERSMGHPRWRIYASICPCDTYVSQQEDFSFIENEFVFGF